MIDRVARRQLATLLRRLLARQVSNDEFAVAVRRCASDDDVIDAIAISAWMLYSDSYEHKIDRSVARAARGDVARWILFLQHDLEYRWCPGPWGWSPFCSWVLDLLTLGWWQRRTKRSVDVPDAREQVAVWPFSTRAEFAAACARPRFLVGV